MADKGLAEHHAAVTVNAPVQQVYGLFTHFNDFPKFMSFVKEVTYYDNQRSHWVAEVVGRHEWDAVNENWIEGRQIGWHSTNGLENLGRVTFQPVGTNQTRVDVDIMYNPPAGVLGDAGENLGAGSRFDAVLQHDLDNFARMVDQAPPGALDPTSSNYLFHSGSAAAKGTTTSRQNETMDRDNTGYPDSSVNPGNSEYSNNTSYRPTLDQDIINDNVPPSGTGTGGIMPNESGMRNPVMPNRNDVTNPVVPNRNDVTNPVVPNEGKVRDPVMPDESDVSNPVMPPERGTTSY
nr:SRPBCC family protein [Ktedonobacteraceae bacterium]